MVPRAHAFGYDRGMEEKRTTAGEHAEGDQHRCPDFDDAIARGFIIEGDGVRLADAIALGPPGSSFQSRTYGPEIAFCPFCGAALKR